MRTRSHEKAGRTKTVLSWQFAKGTHALTCRVESAGRRPSFSVSLLPHWDVKRALIERFPGPSKALARHAGLVSSLRDAGWRVVSYTC